MINDNELKRIVDLMRQDILKLQTEIKALQDADRTLQATMLTRTEAATLYQPK
jgi:hypothetical protein